MQTAKKQMAMCYNNIGIIYYYQGNYPEALKNHFASLKIREELKNKIGIAASYNNIGIIYYNQGAYPEALKNYFASLKIHEELKDKDGIATCYINLGTLQTKLHKLKDAQDYLNKALSLSIEIGSKDDIKASYDGLAELDSTMGNYKLQITHYKQYIIFRDRLNNEETHKKTMQSAMTYEFEKKEAATKAEQDKKDAVAAAEKKRERVIRYSVMGGLVLMFIIALLIFRSLRITRKQKIIIEKQKHLVDEKNNTLNQQNEEIRTQRDEIETQRDEITAQRDLVTQQKDYIEKIYHEISESINYAKRIQQAMLPDLSVIAKAQPEAISTATQSDCFVPRNDEFQLIELKPDKMPVAIYENMKPFTNHVIQLQKDDIIYLASDGYEDQFGGPKHKKFLSKNMKNLLIANCQKPMADQKELLEKAMNNWKGENEQIDDITVMGIKL